MRSARALTLVAGFLVLGLVPVVAALANQPFYLDLFRRIMIFAIAAVSLDLILGFGGMVSFGHAAYLGIGAYAVAIPAFYGIHSGLVQWPLALGLSGRSLVPPAVSSDVTLSRPSTAGAKNRPTSSANVVTWFERNALLSTGLPPPLVG